MNRYEAETELLPLGDAVAMPPHYTRLPVECIDVTEHFNFTLGNAIKYIWRADFKGKPIQDLEKAVWYLRREIDRRQREAEELEDEEPWQRCCPSPEVAAIYACGCGGEPYK